MNNDYHSHAIVDCDGIGNRRLVGLCICQLAGDQHFELATSGIKKGPTAMSESRTINIISDSEGAECK